MRIIIHSASAFALAFGISACEPVEPAAENEPTTCTPYSLVNDRVNGLGMDLCSDGTVVNWDGVKRGAVTMAEGNTVTIEWNGGPISEPETFEAYPVVCRMDGTLQDCPEN